MTDKQLERIIHNHYIAKAGGQYIYNDIFTIKEFIKQIVDLERGTIKKHNLPRYKIGLMFICLNPPYWEFSREAILGARQYFLPDHDVEIMLWTDIPASTKFDDFKKAAEYLYEVEMGRLKQSNLSLDINKEKEIVDGINEAMNRSFEGAKIADTITKFETEPIEWPYPTLLRYNLFLNQEEYLKKFDYIFYCDLDMRFVNIVGDEVLGNGLTAAQHPMYALRREYLPPYEPDNKSTAYIPRPGRVVTENGKPRFEPLYFAGGFQGGKTIKFIKAMKVMKQNIDQDLKRGYVAIWNDESHWNKYLFENSPSVVLSPSYIYPDSLIKDYYVKIWGRDYPPKLVTLTKKFTTTIADGCEVRKKLETM